jgi:hypothetical protein
MRFRRPNAEVNNPGYKPHAPLRTFQEMAVEFGVKPSLLNRFIGLHNGPKFNFRHSNPRAKVYNTWYDPIEMRKWWRELLKTHPQLLDKKSLTRKPE